MVNLALIMITAYENKRINYKKKVVCLCVYICMMDIDIVIAIATHSVSLPESSSLSCSSTVLGGKGN